MNISFILEWQKTLTIARHIHYSLNTNEDFVLFLASKIITCFINIHLHAFGYTSELKTQTITYLLRGSEHVYWILGLQGKVHLIWICRQMAFKNARAIFLV